MSFELHQRKHIDDELKKIVGRQLRRTARALTTDADRQVGSAVHDSRKTVKKVRAVAALLRHAGAKVPRRDRKRLKSAAKALAKLRDSAAIIDTFDLVRRRYPTQLSEHAYGLLHRGLVTARDRSAARAKRDGVLADASECLQKTGKSTKHWTSPSITWRDLIAIIVGSYRQSRQAMKRARLTGQSATLHQWRKEVKTLWYQMRLARPLMIGVAPLIADLKQLETELGDDHNLVVLAATLRGCRDLRSMHAEIRQIDRLAARIRQSLRRRAFMRGRRLHVRKPKTFARWLRTSAKQARPHQAAA